MSGFGVVGRLRERNYHAGLYYLRKGENLLEIHFVIIKNLEADFTAVQQHYTAMGAIRGSAKLIQFESDSITLKLLSGGIVHGWRIIPLTPPVITKQQVDSFSPGQAIPSCTLRAEWTEQSKQVELLCTMTLSGAKEPSNSFIIVLDTGPTQPGADPQLVELLEKYRHQGMIKPKSLKCLFTGPPRTGKTTLKNRLLKTIKNLISLGVASPSGGFENPISVVIGETKERNTALLEDWQTQTDLLDEARTVLGFIHQQPTSQQLASPTFTPDQYTLDPPTSDLPTPGPNSPTQDSLHPPLEANSFDYVKQLMQEVLEKRRLRTIKDIEKTTTLYLMDTGGQPEFHEIMPLILNGPALHLVFFNLAIDLDEPVFIQFCQQDGTNATTTYESSCTGKQMIYQLLSSLYCLSIGISPHSKPTAVLIGTHLDQLKKKIEEINDSLKSLSNIEFHDRGFLTYPKEDENIFIPVNNYSGGEEEIEHLQVFLRQIIVDRFNPVELPSSWLFFHLILRHRYESSPGVCRLAECRALAKGCGLDEKDVSKVLQYIHQNLGTHYPVL